MNIQRRIAVSVIIFLSIIPALIWIFSAPIIPRFASLVMIMRSFGQLAGLVGMALFALNIILAARIRIVDKIFGGLNHAFIYHHIFGAIAFIFLMAHPVILAARLFTISGSAPLKLITPSLSNKPILYGIVALTIMIAALVITFYFVKIKYERWKFTHQTLGFAFFFASLHVLFVQSDVATNMILRYYLLALVICAFISLLWRLLINRHVVQRAIYTVASVEKVAETMYEIVLNPVRKLNNFNAGQFVFISFLSTAVSGESHPYSIASAPQEKALRFVIKQLGDHSSKLAELHQGDKAVIEGPFGSFHYRSGKNKRQIWIAGGVGIAPFLGLAREIALKGNGGRVIDLYYSVKIESEAVAVKELAGYGEKGVLKFHFHDVSKSGFLTSDKIISECKDALKSDIFICGPTAMMDAFKDRFSELGVSKEFIHTEEFYLR